jgi:hypothetical protein
MTAPAALIVARTLALSMLALPHAWAAAQSADGPRQAPEAVMAFRATGQELVFRVRTGGCTRAEDFRVAVERAGHDVSLSLARQRPDHCKGWFPEGIELSIPYADVGLQAADRVRLVSNVVVQAEPAQ